jgi:hypothetical protein
MLPVTKYPYIEDTLRTRAHHEAMFDDLLTSGTKREASPGALFAVQEVMNSRRF